MNNTITRTKTYLLPNLISQYSLDKTKIISIYLGIKDIKPSTRTSVFILVKNDEGFENFLNRFQYDKDILLEYEYKNTLLYDKFIKGEFSKFEDVEKTEIINYYSISSNDKVYQILYKSPTLRMKMEKELKVSLKNYELGEIINYKNECYDTELSRD